MTKANWRDAARKGLGRAVLVAQHSRPPWLDDAVFDALTRDDTYDPQCNRVRVGYLLDLWRACRSPDTLRQRVLDGLPNRVLDVCRDADAGHGQDQAVWQINNDLTRQVRVATAWGADESARAAALASVKAALNAFDPPRETANAYTAQHELCNALVTLDGIAGLRTALRYAHDPQRHATVCAFGRESLLRDAATALGESSVRAVASEFGDTLDPRDPVEAFMSRRSRDLPPVASLDDELANGTVPGTRARRWGREATPTIVEHALRRLRATRDPGHAWTWWCLLETAGLPHFEPWMIQWATVPAAAITLEQSIHDVTARHTRLAQARACVALGRLGELNVANAARRWIDQDGHNALRLGVIDLLGRSLTANDAATCLAACADWTDDDNIHAVAYAIERTATIADPAAWFPLAEWAYEHNPCATCRYAIARHAIDAGVAPAWWPDELQHDAARPDPPA